MNPPHPSIYEFGTFRLDVAEHRLFRDGRPVALTPKLVDLLRILVEHAGHLVDKETLLREVWSGTFVEEGSLSRGISVLRKTLGDDPSGSRYIETVPKRGYRFVAGVRLVPAPSDGAPATGTELERENVAASQDARPLWRPGRQRTLRAAMAVLVILLAGVASYVGRGQNVSTAGAGPGASIHRQLTFTGRELTPAMSPDRTRIAYITNESPERRVIVQQISDGQRIAIFHAPEVGALRWSHDGTQVLFWARGGGTDGVFVTSASGGDARKIAPGAFVAAWSPDASAIAVADFATQRIVVLDHSRRIVRTIALKGIRGWIADLDWSPVKGALLFVAADSQGRPSIWSVRADGSAQSQLVTAEEEITAARWGPRGDAIYYLRRVAQTMALFKAVVRDGPAATVSGPPLLSGLESDGTFALSADAQALVYARAPYAANLWLVETPALPDTKPRTRPLTNGTSVADRPRVSPDGTSIAFNMGVESRANVYTMPAAGGAARQVTHFDALSLSAVWSADGRSIAFASTEGGTRRLWIVGVNDGAARPVAGGEMSDSFDVVWSPGQRPLYQQTGNRNFFVVDPESRQAHLLIADTSLGWAGSPAYSPDGRTIALFRTHRGRAGIWTIDAAGSREALVYGPASASEMVPMPIGWSPDGSAIVGVEGKRVAYRGVSTPFGETLTDVRIVRVPAAGGHPSLLARLPFEEVGGIAISPDGRWLVCSVYTSRSDVWMVEGFDRAAAR